jgi:hypothetical protein
MSWGGANVGNERIIGPSNKSIIVTILVTPRLRVEAGQRIVAICLSLLWIEISQRFRKRDPVFRTWRRCEKDVHRKNLLKPAFSPLEQRGWTTILTWNTAVFHAYYPLIELPPSPNRRSLLGK